MNFRYTSVPGAGLEPARPIGARDFKSLVSTVPPPRQVIYFEPMEGLEPPLDYSSLVYKTSAVATEPHRHIMEESLKSDFTEGLEPSKVCF